MNLEFDLNKEIHDIFGVTPGEKKMDKEMTTGEIILKCEKEIEDLEREKALIIKPHYERYEAALALLAHAAGGEYAWQSESGTVFKLVKPEGTFVRFKEFDINRTRFDEKAAKALGVEQEIKGSLSMTAARELGYEVEGK